MEYTVAVEIELPLAKVIKLFDNPDNWLKWREGFVSAEPVRGSPGEEKSLTKLVHRIGGRTIEMTEEVERKNLPEQMTCVYEAPGFWFGAWNRVTSRFRELEPKKTEWEFESEFRCRGLLKVMATFTPGMFRSASLKEMNNFKAFAENKRNDAE